jgi:hypothetical protein
MDGVAALVRVEAAGRFSDVLAETLVEKGYHRTWAKYPDYARLAREIDVFYETLRKAVAGEREPTRDLMEKCAKKLRIDPLCFEEYRLLVARDLFDPKVVGDKKALKNLREFVASHAR